MSPLLIREQDRTHLMSSQKYLVLTNAKVIDYYLTTETYKKIFDLMGLNYGVFADYFWVNSFGVRF